MPDMAFGYLLQQTLMRLTMQFTQLAAAKYSACIRRGAAILRASQMPELTRPLPK
jgi:hypothetical protein